MVNLTFSTKKIHDKNAFFQLHTKRFLSLRITCKIITVTKLTRENLAPAEHEHVASISKFILVLKQLQYFATLGWF